jgi:DNA-binding response OmpR family regulator
VLLVEDDRDTRTSFHVALKAAGFQVVSAGDGLDALRLLDVAMPDVIVLDLGLPRLTGHDVIRELAARGDTCKLPIVVVTGREPDRLPQTGNITVLRKPTSPELVVAAGEHATVRQIR